MKNELKVKVAFVLVLLGLSIYALWPSVERYFILGRENFEKLQTTDPERYESLTEKALHLGLDLQGGMYLLLGVRTDEVLDKELEGRVNDLKDRLGSEKIAFLEVKKVDSILEASFADSETMERGRTDIESFLGEGFHISSRSELNRQVLLISAVPAYVQKIREDAFNQVIETLRNRVDQLGVSEPVIQKHGLTGHRILIQLPGLKDPAQAKRVIGKVAALEFRIVRSTGTKESLMERIPGGCPDKDADDNHEIYTCPDGSIILPGEIPSMGRQNSRGYYHLEANVPASGRDLEGAQQGSDEYGKPSVQFTVKSASSEAFGRLTRDNLGKDMAIILDGFVKSAPTLQGRITSRGEITGNFTAQEAYELALTLRSGALPASVEYLEQRSVGPSLGDDSIRQGRNSFIAATVLVIAFMIFYYGVNGLNAVVCLGFGMLMLMAGLALTGATLTIPGIAGLVLTLGMGVDANVLIFERMRDELKIGRSVRTAVAAGFDKAFSAIADSHVTQLIAALLLFQFGTGAVRGFAVTLTMGVVTTVFAAVFVSHMLFDLQLHFWPKLKMRFGNILHWVGLSDPPNIDFFKYRRVALAASLAATLFGVALLGWNTLRTGSSLNWGIDFTGGSLVQVQFTKPVDIAEVRAVVRDAGFDPAIQQFGDAHEFLIRTFTAEQTIAENRAQLQRKIQENVKLPFQLQSDAEHAELVLVPEAGTTPEDLKAAVLASAQDHNASVSVDEGRVHVRITEVASRILQALKAKYEPAGNTVTERRTEQVGPQVGDELKTSAFLALALGLFAQLIYITARFEFRYALGGIVALFHDVFVSITVLALLYYEIDMAVVAAILTILGYSINDKIVVFDRMRENSAIGRKQGFIALINSSTNEMLSRTLLTSMAIGSAFILWMFGGEALKSFALALTVGIIAGTYSSVYIAAPVAYYYDVWSHRRSKSKR